MFHLIVALAVFMSCGLFAQPTCHADTGPGATLKVGVAGSEPFVADKNGELGGLSVEVWRAVTARAGVSSDLVRQPSVQVALAALEAGELDVVVGPVSITAERASRVRFTQPYFQGRLSILSPKSDGFARFAPLISRAFLAGIALLLVVLFGVGTLLWLVERKANPEQFPESPAAGIGNGVWLALVTMTTVGYGDRAPVTKLGRVITGIWMVIALISASSLTAGIATGLTLSQLQPAGISRVRDLADEPVAVVTGTTGAAFAKNHRARLIETNTLLDAVALVNKGEARALVFDRPMLEYYLKQNPASPLDVSAGAWEPQGYGFALSADSELVRSLNVALLQLTEAGEVRDIVEDWLGTAGEN